MTTSKIVAPKKLIEVALPLDDINKAAAREKSIRHGHPSTLHLWWARRPLAAARAVLFAQLVNDPSWKYSEEDLKKPQVKSAITRKRNELFRLITELVKWESTTKKDVFARARAEIRASWKETCEANKDHPEAAVLFDAERVPAFHDPFAGGGAIPLEAQRLGLSSIATDLNPVSVLINKAMIEVPPRFSGRGPVGQQRAKVRQTEANATENWTGSRGLAEDARRYAQWMRDEAYKRVGHLYPPVQISKEMTVDRPDLKRYVGRSLPVIAWLWARTVTSPNPAFAGVVVPLVSSWMLSRKAGREVWIEPRVAGNKYTFSVRAHHSSCVPPINVELGTRAGRGASFRCLLSDAVISSEFLKAEGTAGRMGVRLLAIVLEGDRERVYVDPCPEQEKLAATAQVSWKPIGGVPERLTGGTCYAYGLTSWDKLFSSRQLLALETFSGLVGEVQKKATADAQGADWPADQRSLEDGGCGAIAYGEAMALYAAIAVSRLTDRNNTLCTWNSGPASSRASTGASATTPSVRALFSRQAIPMTWDFAEASPFSDSGGGLESAIRWIIPALELLPAEGLGRARQADARSAITNNAVVSTDPPYFDNISYAELSDFFYVWLRRSLSPIFPHLFETLLVPKTEELIANQARHGGKTAAQEFFLKGMTEALSSIASRSHKAFPLTIYYAFKQSDTDVETGTASTGWETFLEAVLAAGLAVVGTWPMRTERSARTVGIDANVLASSIILVCRSRVLTTTIARKDLVRDLGHAMPTAIAEMIADPIASIAPVDLAQACIGPGIALFSKHSAVLEADGLPMTVHNALIYINKAIDESFAHVEGELDADTRFCIGWFDQYGFDAGEFGKADVLARAKGTSVDGLKEAGVVEAGRGKVRLLSIKDLPKRWDPTTDARAPVWEALHHMCKALGVSEGEAGALLAKMPQKQDAIRQLAYRLYTLCAERKKQAELGRPYNDLITSWPAIVEASQKVASKQLGLL